MTKCLCAISVQLLMASVGE